MNIETNLEKLEKKIEKNANKIDENSNRIQQNTGALEILKTFKADSNKFFVMWLITFITLILSLCCIMFLLHK